MFTSNIINIYGAHGAKWLKNLPKLTADIAKRLGLSALSPVANLSYNYVLSGFQGNNPIILKLGLDTDSLKQEACALNFFAGHGAAKVISEEKGLLLLQRAIPGVSLKSHYSSKENETINIACNAMKQLHQAKLPPASHHLFPHIKDWLTILNLDWAIPADYLQKARQLRDKLLQNSTQDILLHGDLHHDNILKNNDDWIVIDPKGVIGPSIFETWAFVIDIEKDTQFIANFFDFNLQDVRDWYFIHLILATCWNLEDNIDDNLFLGLAQKAYPLTK